jgi:hypothetical protein
MSSSLNSLPLSSHCLIVFGRMDGTIVFISQSASLKCKKESGCQSILRQKG